MELAKVENACQNNDLKEAGMLFFVEWNRSTGDLAQFYYQVIRDGLVGTFQLMESRKLCSERDSFLYCSNAMLELDIKNVPITEEMRLRVMHRLSAYGLWHLCGDPIKYERSWRDSIDLVVQWVGELRDRPNCYDFLDIDNEVIFRIRMIHNHLFFIKDQTAMQELPLKELIFCLAIFVPRNDEIQESGLYKVVINKRNIMQFLVAIASRLNAIRQSSDGVKHNHSRVLKRLRKAYRRVKQMHSVFKVIQCSQFYENLEASAYKRCSASLTVAASKRFNQICGEAIKSTADTPNLSTKLSNILPNLLTDSVMFNSQYRDFSSHGFPLSHLFVRDADQTYYYEYLSDYLRMTAVSFQVIFVYILHDYTRYSLGLMRHCRTIDDLRALIRYMGSNKIRSLHEDMFKQIEQYFLTLESRLSEIDPESVKHAEKHYHQKLEIINNLRNSYRNNVRNVIEVMAFTNASISAVHRLLDHLLTDKSSSSYFEAMFTKWEVPKLYDNIEFNAAFAQFYIHQYLELGNDSSEQWRYRLKTQEILEHFTSDIKMDESIRTTLEENLHSALCKTRNGYYQHIFALDSKSQAITQTLKVAITGSKSSKDFNKRNKTFRTQLEALRGQDEQELCQVMQKILQNIREAFQRYDCTSIEKLYENHKRIPMKARLAIEFWQLQTMEILYSSGYLGDNFCLVTRSVPMIWGKSYRNYLAHDSVSYDLLTSSDSIKTLINGFVLAFNSSELKIFTRPDKFKLDGLVDLQKEGFRWVKLQSGLLESVRRCNVQLIESFLDEQAEPSGRYLLALGKFLCPRYYAIPEIIAHKHFDCDRIEVVVSLLNMLKINDLASLKTIPLIKMFRPCLTTPIVGAVLPLLVFTNNFDLLYSLLDLHAGSFGEPMALMATERTIKERNFLEVHLGLRRSIISESYKEDLSAIFTEDNRVSMEELEIVIQRNDMRLFEHIVQNCYQTSSSVLSPSDMLQAMESCCLYGRLQMVSCLLNSGLVCDPHLMSSWLTFAITNHHWKIVDLLFKKAMEINQPAVENFSDKDKANQKEPNAWFNNGIHALSLLIEKNFKILRKSLKDGIPNHLTENFISRVAQLGSKRLLKQLVDMRVDIWKCKGILAYAAMNQDASVLSFLENMIFEPIKKASSYDECRRWIKMLQDLKALMLISMHSDFILVLIRKKSIIPSIAELWIDRIVKLLKIEDDFAKYFHFEDPSGRICPNFPENQVNEDQFERTLQTCSTFVDLIKSVPPGLIPERMIHCIEFRSPDKTIEVEVDLTIYSPIKLAKPSEERTTILTQDFCHTADVISTGLRTFLSNLQYPKTATATVSLLSSSERFHYIQIDSNSCIVQTSPKETINLSHLLNRPGQYCVLHNLRPDSSPRLVESLLQLGADPTLQHDRSGTPFLTALAAPFPLELFKLMYQHYEKSHHHQHETNVLNIKDLDGYTPLLAAINTNNYEVTEFLLQNGADIALADQCGEVGVLKNAICNRNVRLVELLLRHCPDLAKECSREFSALELAVMINHEHIVRLLLECGADLNWRNVMNLTPLRYAIEHESVESLQVMLDYAFREGVIVDGDIDGRGTTALEYARVTGVCPEIMQLLVCHSIKSEALALMTINLGLDN